MEEESEETELKLLTEKLSRQSCFAFKQHIENNPASHFVLKLVIGSVFLMHIWLPVILLSVALHRSSTVKYSALVLPFILLLTELLFFCGFVLFIILRNISSSSSGSITLWQRQSIMNLVKTISISLFLITTLILLYNRLDQHPVKILSSLSPVIFLNSLILLRYFLIKSDLSLFNSFTSLLTLVQQTLLVLKVDYECSIDWEVVFIPCYFECFFLLFRSFYLLYRVKDDLLKAAFLILTCTGFSLVLCSIVLYFFFNLKHYGLSLSVIGFVLSSIGEMSSFGSFIIELATGHIESDLMIPKFSLSYSKSPHSV